MTICSATTESYRLLWSQIIECKYSTSLDVYFYCLDLQYSPNAHVLKTWTQASTIDKDVEALKAENLWEF